jgi:hypothetical protein
MFWLGLILGAVIGAALVKVGGVLLEKLKEKVGKI